MSTASVKETHLHRFAYQIDKLEDERGQLTRDADEALTMQHDYLQAVQLLHHATVVDGALLLIRMARIEYEAKGVKGVDAFELKRLGANAYDLGHGLEVDIYRATTAKFMNVLSLILR